MLDGIAGREETIRNYILAQIQEYCTYSVDPLGNIIAYKKGENPSKHTIMVSAHMDEVGMIVTGYQKDGMLRIDTVGGIDPRVILGRTVTIENKINGVIGTKAVHMQTADEKGSAVSIDKLYVDIGATDDEEAAKYVQLGDQVCFQGAYGMFGNGRIKGKAIDDRIGCAMMIKLIQSKLTYDTVFAFVTQEEIGLRGSTAVAYTINPDIAIVLEATTAADLSNVEGAKRTCELGKGPVVGFMDRATIYDKDLYRLAYNLAKEQNLLCQTKTTIAGGNDAGAISKSRGGVKTIAISVPCRYLHSPFCVIDQKDAEQMLTLVSCMLQKIGEV